MTAPNPAIDLVFVGGTVHRFDDEPAAQAVAVRGGRIAAVGDDDDIRALADASTTVVELAGRTVIPGINDSHMHAAWLGALWPQTLMGAMAAGDGAAPPQAQPLRNAVERRSAILRAADLALSLGITSVTEPGLGPGEDDGETGCFGSEIVAEYRALAAERALPVRVTALSLFGIVDGPSRWEDFEQGLANLDHTSPDDRFLHFAGVKIFADGIPPMHAAYTDRRYTSDARPELLVEGATSAEREAHFTKMVVAAHRAGLQVAVHATGDKAIELFLDAIELAREDNDVDLRHYVIHGDLVTAKQLQRMARLGVGYNTQAGIPLRTAAMVDAALGEGAAAEAWPLQAVSDAGVALRLSSDSPVLEPDWRAELAAADQWMGPADDAHARMDLLLRSYTVAGAYQDGAEAWKGTLTPGMAADLCVLAADPFTVSPAELPDVDVDMTIVDGVIAYDRASVSV